MGSRHSASFWAFFLTAALTAIAACGSTRPAFDSGGADGGTGDPSLNASGDISSLTIDPPTATITILNGAIVTQTFDVIGHLSDGTTT
ncbi:MAG: hypothetical protein ABIP39_08205, partial [Polyangiaceae bacterium]